MFKWFMCFLIFLSISHEIAGQEVIEKRHNLKSLIDIAINRNYKLRAIRSEQESLNFAADASKKYMNPKLNFEIQRLPATSPYRFDNVDMYMLSISQEIILPSKLDKRYDIAIIKKQKKEQELNYEISKISASLQMLYFGLYGKKKEYELLSKKRDTLKEIIDSAEQLYLNKKGMQSDIFQMRSELKMLDSRMESLRADIYKILAELSAFTDLQLNEGEISFDDVSIEDAEIDEKKALEFARLRPEIKITELEKKMSQIEYEYARSSSLVPDLMVSGGYGYSYHMPDGFYFMFSINLPFFNSRNEDEVKMQQKMYGASSEMLKQMILETESESLYLSKKINSVISAKKYIGEAIDLSKLRFESEKTAYLNGSGLYINMIQALKDLYEAQIEFYRMESELGMLYAELERCCNAPISELKITKEGGK